MAERVARPEFVCLGEPEGQDDLEWYLGEGAHEAGMWDVTLAAIREGVETSGRSIYSLRDEAITDLEESAASGTLDEASAAQALELTAAMFYFAEHPEEFDTSRYADLFVEYHSSCTPS